MDDAFGHWFAGFTDGEGCFSIRKTGHIRRRYAGSLQCCFSITLRADDLPVLQHIKATLGFGNIYLQNPPSKRVNSHPAFQWAVSSQAGCMRLVELFDQFPLRAKKSADFGVWREAVVYWVGLPKATRKTGQRDMVRFEELRQKLKAVRSYEQVDIPRGRSATLFDDL